MRKIFALILLLAAPALAQTTITIDGSDYQVPDHPRVFLDGPTGPVTIRLKDPDGAGAQRAPRAIDGDPAYEGLKSRIRSCVAEAPPYPNCAGGESLVLAAIDWFMDNTQTNSLNFVKYKLNSAENSFGSESGVASQLACDINVLYCGVQDNNHNASYGIIDLSQAYSIVRSEMSAGERTAFAQKMLNDVDPNIGEVGSCDNQLQRVTGAAITGYTGGSTALAGTGMAAIAPGTKLLFKPTLTTRGGWAVATVVTDTLLTLAASIKDYQGNPFPTMTAGQIWEVEAITATTCGAVWWAGNHLSNHYLTFGRQVQSSQTEQIDTTETDITVADASVFPTPPFLVKTNAGEVMRVTAVNGNALTVQRDWPTLDGVGLARFSGVIWYNKMHPTGATDFSPHNNRVLLKAAAALAAGLAGLDDMPAEAENFIDQSGWFMKDYAIPLIRPDWTGFTQGGSYYSYAISTRFSLALVDMLRHFTPVGAAPTLDYSQDGWINAFVYGLIYNGLPGAPNTPISWGNAGVAEARNYVWPPFINAFAPASTAAEHVNYWLTTASGNYVSTTLDDSLFKSLLVLSLIHMPTTITSTDYSTLPTHRAFNVVHSPPGKPLGTWISRTGFSSASDTVLWVNAHAQHPMQSDHMHFGAPGSYRIYKNGYLLTENTEHNVSAGGSTNMMLFGLSHSLKSYTSEWQEVWNDKSDGAATWAYARVNSVNAYTPVAAATRALRHIIHFKAGNPDFTVVYDDVASSSGKTKGFNLWHDEGCSTYSYSEPTVTCRRSASSLFSQVVYPAAANLVNVAGTTLTGKYQTLCISADNSTCDATNTAGDFLLVHQASSNAAESQVSAAALATIDSDFRGVEIGGSNPAVAIFPKVGLTHTSSSFTTTHTGTATYVVTGLSAGAYDVVRGGVTTVLDDHVVDADDVLSFTSVSGAFTVSQGDPPPPECTVATNSLPDAIDSVAYSHQLLYSGCTGAVTWTKETDTCPEIDATTGGLIEQADPDIGTCTETYKVTDSLAQFGTKELPLTTVAAPATCTITSPTSLPDAVQGVAYDFTLTTSGCTGPLVFTATPSDFCPGLLLASSTGAFSDPPDVVGLCTFTVDLVPTAGGNTSKQHTILVNAPPPSELQILTTTPLPDCVRSLPCSTTFMAGGGTPPYIWSKASGDYCVGNDNLDANTGVLSGPATTFETCTFDMLVTDSATPTPDTDQRTFQRTIISPVPGMAVVVTPGSSGAIIKYGTPSLPREQTCESVVSDLSINEDTGETIGVVAQVSSQSGYATRIVSVSGLTPEHPHEVIVTCGDIASGSARFDTVAAVGGTMNRVQRATPSAGLVARGAVKISWYAERLDTSGDVQVLHTACSPGPCDVTLTLVSGGNYSIAHAWETTGNTEITRSVRPQFVAVP